MNWGIIGRGICNQRPTPRMSDGSTAFVPESVVHAVGEQVSKFRGDMGIHDPEQMSMIAHRLAASAERGYVAAMEGGATSDEGAKQATGVLQSAVDAEAKLFDIVASL